MVEWFIRRRGIADGEPWRFVPHLRCSESLRRFPALTDGAKLWRAYGTVVSIAIVTASHNCRAEDRRAFQTSTPQGLKPLIMGAYDGAKAPIP